MSRTGTSRAVLTAMLCSLALTGCAAAGSITTTSTSPPPTRTAEATEATTATGAQPLGPAPASTAHAPCPDRQYTARAFCYLSKAGVRNSMIDADCGPLLANDLRDPGHTCLSDIQSYETFLQGAQSDLRLQDLASVPANLREPATWLARAVRDDLLAARMATTAIQSHNYLGFLDAWGVHGKAGGELQTAGDTFFNH
jgi:hypothetical protein